MAFISRDYYEELKKNKLIEHGDWIKLHRMSKEVGIKKGEGYAAHTFRNAVVKGFTTTNEVVTLIESFYAPKVESIKLQRDAVKNMRKKLAEI